MASQSFTARELFHLLFLRQLAARLAGRRWAVKGGICLRFFHRSARLSEDLDCDVAAGMRSDTLRGGVEAVLKSQALQIGLAGAGIAAVRATATKQTETTQRWKVALRLVHAHELPTKVEFSRRTSSTQAVSGSPSSDILATYACPPFAVPYYDAPAMAVQKVLALASPGRHAPRDLFDLDHLLTHGGVLPAALRKTAGNAAASAAEKAAEFTQRDFAEEVLPFLTDELVEAYRGSEAFRRLRERVIAALSGG